MNTKKYMQTDSKWGSLPYPKKPCTIRNDGCGEVSIANILIEMQKYANYTPATIQPYCKQFADPSCNGTYWSGIPKMLKHYGLTEVKEHATMPKLWTELAKGNRVAIYLMGSRKGGSKKVHWTSGGHFVASVGYKVEKGLHKVYMKDSYSNSSLRNGWISYEENMKGDVLKVWSAKLVGTATTTAKPTTTTPTTVKTGSLKVDGIGGKATVTAMQQYFKTTDDGVISGQVKKQSVYYPALTSVQFGKGGSICIRKLQAWCGVTQDGILGKGTSAAWQKKLRDLGYLAKTEKIDGYFGVKSMKAWQKFLNDKLYGKATTPTTTTTTKPATTTTTTTTATAGKYKVIDVSEWQGKIDWKKVKADGVVGAIIRYADGTYLDPNFATNMKNAKANGLHVGAYIFSRAKTKADAEKEATRLFNACKQYSPDMPLYIDLEAKGLEKYADTVAQAYLDKIKALGGYGGVYANLNWWNNYLKKTAKRSFAMWLAQYNSTMNYKPASDVGMWQYSSSGSVKGISGRVDMNHCYVAYWNKIKPTPAPTPTPTPTPEKKSYTGTYPSYRLIKSNAKVKSDAVAWAKKIADNNDFHYGYGKDAHHNGCFYCGTQPKSKEKSGIKKWQTTYCCNPFVGAAWAHGGGDAQAYKMCNNGTSWDFGKGNGSYHTSKLFDNLGKPSKDKLQVGDVLCSDRHVALYVGNGKVVQAGHEDDNKINSSKWNSSISVGTWNNWTRVYRYNGKVDCDRVMTKGEYSDRIKDLQKYLVWYGYNIKVTGFFNTETFNAVVKFQEAELGKGQGDGIVGQKTIDAMKKVKK